MPLFNSSSHSHNHDLVQSTTSTTTYDTTTDNNTSRSSSSGRKNNENSSSSKSSIKIRTDFHEGQHSQAPTSLVDHVENNSSSSSSFVGLGGGRSNGGGNIQKNVFGIASGPAPPSKHKNITSHNLLSTNSTSRKTTSFHRFAKPPGVGIIWNQQNQYALESTSHPSTSSSSSSLKRRSSQAEVISFSKNSTKTISSTFNKSRSSTSFTSTSNISSRSKNISKEHTANSSNILNNGDAIAGPKASVLPPPPPPKMTSSKTATISTSFNAPMPVPPGAPPPPGMMPPGAAPKPMSVWVDKKGAAVQTGTDMISCKAACEMHFSLENRQKRSLAATQAVADASKSRKEAQAASGGGAAGALVGAFGAMQQMQTTKQAMTDLKDQMDPAEKKKCLKHCKDTYGPKCFSGDTRVRTRSRSGSREGEKDTIPIWLTKQCGTITYGDDEVLFEYPIIEMESLKVGDEVEVAEGEYEPVVGWLDRNPNTEAEFVKIGYQKLNHNLTKSQIISDKSSFSQVIKNVDEQENIESPLSSSLSSSSSSSSSNSLSTISMMKNNVNLNKKLSNSSDSLVIVSTSTSKKDPDAKDIDIVSISSASKDQEEYLLLTPDHMIWSKDKFLFAEDLNIGDELSRGYYVTSINIITKYGIYAPLVASGQIMINGQIIASCYAIPKQMRLNWNFIFANAPPHLYQYGADICTWHLRKLKPNLENLLQLHQFNKRKDEDEIASWPLHEMLMMNPDFLAMVQSIVSVWALAGAIGGGGSALTL